LLCGFIKPWAYIRHVKVKEAQLLIKLGQRDPRLSLALVVGDIDPLDLVELGVI
jgi:hypothetical protein